LPPTLNEDHLQFLLSAAKAAVSTEAGARLLFVQHSGAGRSGRGAASLARTIHLEARDLTTCVVDVPYDKKALPWVVQELKSAVGYSEAVYDTDGVRRVPRLSLLPKAAEEAELALTADDVLLVTGGGKGIGAECAFALAKEHGVRLALMGRSLPGEDDELAANLERLRAGGVSFSYVTGDVTDADAVAKAVAEVREQLGEVSAFLHSAGINQPQLIRGLDEDGFRRTLAPKLHGLQNVLAALDPDRLRLMVAFGSIIARSGLRGEADYAVANEWLENSVASFAEAHPDCRCLCVEWSVWSGVGMGERLGRVQELANEGVTAITPDNGLAVIDGLLRRELSSPSVVVTGRFGRPATLEPEGTPLPLLRFLEKTQVYYPGVELVSDAELTLDNDPYLSEHVFRGQRLLPAVMGMEAMAQAAMALAESKTPPSLQEVRFERPVVLPESGRLTIRVAALKRQSGAFEVALRSEESSFAIDHFRAVCRFDQPWPPKGKLGIEKPRRLEPVSMEPQSELYGGLLFHQGRFRRLERYRQVAATACEAEIGVDSGCQWFGPYQAAEMVLGDPALSDTAIHAIQVCVPDVSLLPVGVQRLQVDGEAGEGPWITRAKEQAHDGDLYTYDVEVVDRRGRVVQCWQGLQLATITGAEHQGEWVPPLLGPYLERELMACAPLSGVSVAVENGTGETRAQRRDRAVRRVAGCEAEVIHRGDGKPELSGGLNLSVTHTENFTLAVSGKMPVGCDAQVVAGRDADQWRELLGQTRYALAETVAKEIGEEVAVAATRVWTVVECLAKLGVNADSPVTLEPCRRNRWVRFASGDFRAASTVEKVAGMAEPVALAVMVRSDDAGV
jgi:enediyne polyketide synthase